MIHCNHASIDKNYKMLKNDNFNLLEHYHSSVFEIAPEIEETNAMYLMLENDFWYIDL